MKLGHNYMSSGQNWRLIGLAFVFWAAVTGTAVVAQEVAPSSSIETYGSWTVQCSKFDAVAEGAASKICEAMQSYSNSETRVEIARLAIGKDANQEGESVLVLRTVVDVTFEGGAIVTADGKNITGGPFVRCVPNACFANLEISESIMNKMFKAKVLSFEFHLSNGQRIRIAMSNSGMKDAVTAMRGK